MSETNPGYSDDQPAGEVGAHRAVVGTPTDPESVNVPPTRPGAAENAYEAEARRREHETFIPENPEPDDRTDAVRSRGVEEESLGSGTQDGPRVRRPESTTPYQSGTGTTATPYTGQPRHGHDRDGDDEDEEERVRQSIRETRRELGDTVSALAHKADVKSRAADAAESAKERAGEMAAAAKAKAAEVTGTAKAKAAELTGTAKVKAAEMSDTARSRTAEVTGTAKTRANEMSGAAMAAAAEASGQALQLKDRARDAAPEEKRPLLLLAVAVAVTAVLVRRARRRRLARRQTSWRAGWHHRSA